MEYALAGSRGRQFPIQVQVNSIIGQRAIRKNRMSVARLESEISKLCDSCKIPAYPSTPTFRRWADADPGLPEFALRTGLVSPSELLPWAAEFVDEAQAGLKLETRSNYGTTKDLYDETTAIEQIVGVAFVGYISFKALQWLFSGSSNVPVRRITNTRPFN